MPLPFERELKVTEPPMQGNDVLIATTLMSRCSSWNQNNIPPSNIYTTNISNQVSKFQTANNLNSNGIFDPKTANLTLLNYSYDGYKDNNVKASDYNVSYKLYFGVYSDLHRDIQVTGHLYDPNNVLLFEFDARLHGESNPPSSIWPDYSNIPGLNEFTTNGNTPTGLSYCDLNTPEPNSTLFGPYPVHRVVSGINTDITTNSQLLLPNIRDGVLMHTGEWPNWNDDDQMPNSSGCIHIHPDDLAIINQIVMSQLGVIANKNPFSGKNYPFKPQCIISIEQL